MKGRRTIGSFVVLRVLGVLGAFLLAGCSGEHVVEPAGDTKPEPDPEPVNQQITTPLYLRGYVANYKEDGGAMTRAFSFPGYEVPAEYMPIGAFFTQGGATPVVESRRIVYNTVDEKWTYTPPDEIAGGDYQLYGYMPSNAADVTITPNSDYADGATLRFEGMNIVTSKDLCVLVGAKHGTDAEHPAEDGGVSLLKTGNFDCHMYNGVSASNYLFLLFDHIYASIYFRFRLDEDYAKLRSIHLKKLQLTAYADNTFTVKKKRLMDAVVELGKTTDGSSPIQSITFEDHDGSELINQETFFEGDLELKSGADEWSDGIAYVPYTRSYYTLRSTYDVYDRKGNLIRQNCVAENKINPFAILNISDLQRGHKYVLKLTVAPTYLYQLSDQDLDNPTITIQ